MGEKKILTVGFSICSEDVECVDFMSNRSLLDGDIILFRPKIKNFIASFSVREGKIQLPDETSFKLRKQISHWKREIKEACNNGKLVIVYLTEIIKMSYIDEDLIRKRAPNANVGISNYDSIPVNLDLVEAEGKAIILSGTNSEIISLYWKELSKYSEYKVTLEGNPPTCLVTRGGEKTVGAIYRVGNSDGALVLLPDIDFFPLGYYDREGAKSEEAVAFAAKLIESVVTIDRNLRNADEIISEPEWVKDNKFKLEKEKIAEDRSQEIKSEIERMQMEKKALEKEIKDLGRLRNLLFANGKPLELAVLDALKILEFDNVHSFNDGKSEFDAVFESDEGKFIGEVEGKDNKAIDFDKFRQLILNTLESLNRDDTPVKGVLFGNAYRLSSPLERKEPFTQKCIVALETSPVALVSTPDLFEVAKYLSDNPTDKHFAAKCRETLSNSVGIVEFPEIPNSDGNPNKTSQEN